MNQSKLLRWSITVALAGFLFGFDTVVISGADQALQEKPGLVSRLGRYVIRALGYGYRCALWQHTDR